MNAPFSTASVEAPARRLLVVSPHFPPADVVDMHRVRMNVGHYKDYGWAPTVLSVRPEHTGRLIDWNLAHTVPEDVHRLEAGAIPLWLTRPLGVTALGLRAFLSLRAAGERLLSSQRFDLALISTTMFPIMMLGAHWKRKFGVPYVLDMQDPWYTAPDAAKPFARKALKHRAMRRLHKAFEQRALTDASGIISVSPDYIDALRAAYPTLRQAPCDVIPFGFARSDLEVAQRLGRPLFLSPSGQEAPVCLFAGRGGTGMERALKTLFAIVRRSENESVFRRLRYVFLGTGYQRRRNPRIIEPIAMQFGVDALMREFPDRAPLLDTLRALTEADVLLLLGSEDLSYQPSKLYQYLNFDRPILCIASSRSRLMKELEGLDSVVLVASDGPITDETIRTAAGRLASLMSSAKPGAFLSGERLRRASQYEARVLAGRECALLDSVLARGQA